MFLYASSIVYVNEQKVNAILKVNFVQSLKKIIEQIREIKNTFIFTSV